jgi:hypothetical protein
MPVPKPVAKEEQSKFMSRCMAFMNNENAKKPADQKWKRDQMAAICFSQWEKKDKKETEQSSIDEQEIKADEEFVKRFIAKYPQYKSYFEQK